MLYLKSFQPYFSVLPPEKPDGGEVGEVFSVNFLGNELDSDSALTALNALFGVSIALFCMFIFGSIYSGN